MLLFNYVSSYLFGKNSVDNSTEINPQDFINRSDAERCQEDRDEINQYISSISMKLKNNHNNTQVSFKDLEQKLSIYKENYNTDSSKFIAKTTEKLIFLKHFMHLKSNLVFKVIAPADCQFEKDTLELSVLTLNNTASRIEKLKEKSSDDKCLARWDHRIALKDFDGIEKNLCQFLLNFEDQAEFVELKWNDLIKSKSIVLFHEFTPEIHKSICSFLAPKDISVISLVSRKFSEVRDERYWESACTSLSLCKNIDQTWKSCYINVFNSPKKRQLFIKTLDGTTLNIQLTEGVKPLKGIDLKNAIIKMEGHYTLKSMRLIFAGNQLLDDDFVSDQIYHGECVHLVIKR